MFLFFWAADQIIRPLKRKERKVISNNFQYLSHLFLFSKDPSRWERYSSAYDPRYRDPRSYDQRYWYDAEHNPYQKRDAYPYGSRFVHSVLALSTSRAGWDLGAVSREPL